MKKHSHKSSNRTRILNSLFFFLLISIVFGYFLFIEKGIVKNGQSAPGTVTLVTTKRITYSYSVEGTNYTRRSSRTSNQFVLKGEKYSVKYEESNPSYGIMSFKEPLVDRELFRTIYSEPLKKI